MEHLKALVPHSSPPPPSDDHHFAADPEESLFSSLVYDMSQQVQSAMENMLNLTRDTFFTSSHKLLLPDQGRVIARVLYVVLNNSLVETVVISGSHASAPSKTKSKGNFISIKLNREVDQRTSEITEEIGKCKEFGAVRQKVLEEERVHIEKVAYAVLELLHAREAY